MYTEKNYIEIIELKYEIKIVGLNLQKSGLPITFESLGKMWDNYTDECKRKIPDIKQFTVEYGVCFNKIPDYLVGSEVSKIEKIDDTFFSFIIPAGKYIKVTFNAKSYSELVDEKIKKKQKEAFAWAKKNRIKVNSIFNVEVYSQEGKNLEYPEMFCLYPIVE